MLLDEDEELTESTREASPKVPEEELQRMSAFRDFIESLDLDDFDKRKS